MTDTHGSGDGAAAGQPQYGQQPYPPAYPQPYPQPAPQPYGQAPYGVPPAGATPPGHYPYGEQPYGQYAPHLYGHPQFGPPGFGLRDPNRRPGTVLAAGVVTIVFSGLSLLALGILLIAALALRATAEDGFDSDGLLDGSAGVFFFLLMAALLLWCVGAILLAAFAIRRSNGSRIALVVSSALCIVVSLLATIGGGYLAVFTILAGIAVIVLLFTGGANEWYRGRHDSAPVGQAHQTYQAY
jgi:hypothetical protein